MRHIVKFTHFDGTPTYVGNSSFDTNVMWTDNIADAFEFMTADALERNYKRVLWWNEPYSDWDRRYELIFTDMPDIDALVNL